MGKQLEPYSLEKEENLRKNWEKNKIPQKARELSLKNEKTFYFADGPPYATGHIHMGTALNKIMKDTAMRSKRMQGYAVLDIPGYDTHGLPIEHKVEKKLGIKMKDEIYDFGVDKFVDECRNFATEFIDTMNYEFNDLGVWMDWTNPYLTLKNEYIEAIWGTFKKAEEKGLLYLGSYSVHVCSRCETAVAYNEIEYVKQNDTSIFVKFPIAGKENEFFIIWTTTPWTLPGNMGVMVHPDFEYSYVKTNGETWIVAKERIDILQKLSGKPLEEIKTVKGIELKDIEYVNPLMPHMNMQTRKGAYRVVMSSRYVNLEEGTGLVHTAPGHGKEDYEVGVKEGLPVVCPVELNGLLDETTGKYSGKKARIVDSEIIDDLKTSEHLVAQSSITHDYPVCWRCATPLLMLATPQWFFDIKSIQNKLIESNQDVHWTPKWMKARMGNWLESLGDWPVSRERFWGTPLPIWVCENCEERKVFGSLEELKKHADVSDNIDLHKPRIDEITFKCDCGKSDMKRVTSVLDVWFDAGVSTWGGIGHHSNKELFNKFWPADLEIEGTDQVRGWWNSQMITSMICFDKMPFKAVVTHGLVLDISKIKMSKSKGNVVRPKDAIAKYNRDFLRYYLLKQSKGQDVAFDYNDFRDVKRFFSILENSLNYCSLYLDINLDSKPDIKKLETEDKWILAKLEAVKKESIDAYNSYEFFRAPLQIEEFVLNDLSRTYIKLIRDREDKKTVSEVLSNVLYSVLKLLAPVAPHFTDYAYNEFKSKNGKESIHFTLFPELNNDFEDEKIQKKMDNSLALIQEVLALRAKEKIRLRWTLNNLYLEMEEDYSDFSKIIGTLANVTNVTEGNPDGKGFISSKIAAGNIHLDILADVKLKNEWELKELIRLIQGERKNSKLIPGEIAKLHIYASDKEFVESNLKKIEKETTTKLEFDENLKEKATLLIEREFGVHLNKS